MLQASLYSDYVRSNTLLFYLLKFPVGFSFIISMSAVIAAEFSEFLPSLYEKSVTEADLHTFYFMLFFILLSVLQFIFLLTSCKDKRTSVTILFPSKPVCFGGLSRRLSKLAHCKHLVPVLWNSLLCLSAQRYLLLIIGKHLGESSWISLLRL